MVAMREALRSATFNLENLDDLPGRAPELHERIAALRPQLDRLDADVLCLQEINSQTTAPRVRSLAALDALLEGTSYASFERTATTTATDAHLRDVQNLVTLSRFPVVASSQICHTHVPAPAWRSLTAVPTAAATEAVTWERPLLHVSLALPGCRQLEVVNLHLRAPLAAYVEGGKASAFVWNRAAAWAEGFFLSALKRNGQALEARLLVNRMFDADGDALIALCGDFNSGNHEVPVAIVRADVDDTGNAALAKRVMVAVEERVPASARYTVRHSGRPLMLDHILVSPALDRLCQGATAYNEGLDDEMEAYRENRVSAAAFHAPFVATFGLPGT